MPRTGAQYLEDVEDGRSVYLNGARINTVTRHKAYSGAARSIARLYDFQRAPENIERMTFESPATGDRVSRMWQLPRSHADLVARREALVAWAETHYGFMGRSPDHVASTIAGFRMGSHVYEAHGKARAQAVRDYYAFARDRDLYLSTSSSTRRAIARSPEARAATRTSPSRCATRTPRGSRCSGRRCSAPGRCSATRSWSRRFAR